MSKQVENPHLHADFRYPHVLHFLVVKNEGTGGILVVLHEIATALSQCYKSCVQKAGHSQGGQLFVSPNENTYGATKDV